MPKSFFIKLTEDILDLLVHPFDLGKKDQLSLTLLHEYDHLGLYGLTKCNAHNPDSETGAGFIELEVPRGHKGGDKIVIETPLTKYSVTIPKEKTPGEFFIAKINPKYILPCPKGRYCTDMYNCDVCIQCLSDKKSSITDNCPKSCGTLPDTIKLTKTKTAIYTWDSKKWEDIKNKGSVFNILKPLKVTMSEIESTFAKIGSGSDKLKLQRTAKKLMNDKIDNHSPPVTFVIKHEVKGNKIHYYYTEALSNPEVFAHLKTKRGRE